LFCSCVVKWLDLQKERLSHDASNTVGDIDAHMEQLVVEVMSHVRFPMMSPRQLADLLLCPLTKTYKEFFVERMTIGMAFHSGMIYETKSTLHCLLTLLFSCSSVLFEALFICCHFECNFLYYPFQ